MMLSPRASASVASRWMNMARVAAVSTKTSPSALTARPSPSSSPATCEISARCLASFGLDFEKERPDRTLPTSARSMSSLTSAVSHLSLSNHHPKPQRCTSQIQPFSSLAPNRDDESLGEPITFLKLNTLSDNPGAVKKKRRVGRGIGSSKGKTCGRGHKGQKARAGRGVHPSFEGGQTKFYKRLPKVRRMKNHKFKLVLAPLNIGTVQDYVTMGRLIPDRSDGVLTMRDFVRAGMFPNSAIKSGVKLLGYGKEFVKDKLLIEVPWASKSAIDAVESKGGFVTCVHYNRLALRALLKPHRFPPKPEVMLQAEREARGEGGGGDASPEDVHDLHLLPRRARPPVKYMPYYTDYINRGYLSPRVQLERKKRGLKDILLKY